MKDATPATRDSRSHLPAWARGADILTLALVAVALLLAAFGGIRLRMLGTRLSLTSPWRVLGWALAITVVRHIAVRQEPIYRRLIENVRSGIRSTAFGAAWPVFVGTRLPVLLVAYFAVVTIGYRTPDPPNRVSYNEFLNLPSRWDTGWYYGIAIYGYSWNAKPREQQNVVFFPAYPLLMRSVGRLIGAQFMAAGMLITLVAFFTALIYLYGLARQWLDHEKAVTALWLLAAYPFALFFSAAYTESLYLCGAVATFFHFHRGEFVRAGAWGALVGLTRPNGCFLSVPLGILAVERLVSGRWGVKKGTVPIFDRPSGKWGLSPFSRPTVFAFAAAAMPGIGMLLYSIFVYRLTGDAFAWARGHLAWGREYGGVSNLFVTSYQHIANVGLYEYTRSIPLDILNAVPALFVLAMSGLVFKRFGLAYALFLLLNLIPPILVGGFLSVGRFTSVLFPAFFALALLVSTNARLVWIAAFAMGQALTASLFFTWRELY